MTRALYLLIALMVAACGGSSSSGDDGGGDDVPAPDAQQSQPLTCKSIALCTTYRVKTFIGTVPDPAGGAVHDGIYRLAWAMDPTGIGETGGYHEDLLALQIRGKSFNWAGFFEDEIGTIATSGSMITFQDTQNCEMGNDGDASTSSSQFKYTATDTELRIYSHVSRSDGVQWDRMYVYVLASSPADVCKTVNSEPTTPGDSADCQVTNCACKFAVEGTVTSCT